MPAPIELPVVVRKAEPADLPTIVELMIADDLHTTVESTSRPIDPRYVEALATIHADPNNAVYVAELEGEVVGTFQLTFIRQLSNRGGLVAQVETVLVSEKLRSRGIGEQMMRFAIDEARQRGAVRVQLTSNVVRTRAHSFYERLGFVASHQGMKLWLTKAR